MLACSASRNGLSGGVMSNAAPSISNWVMSLGKIVVLKDCISLAVASKPLISCSR